MIDAINANPTGKYWNAIAPITSTNELCDTGIVKCVVSVSHNVLYCARDLSHIVGSLALESVRKILGITGHSREGIQAYTTLPNTPLATSQSIDQLRIIEHDLLLQGVHFSAGYPGINDCLLYTSDAADE